MSESRTIDLGDRVPAPFRTDRDFWLSVCASADAFAVLGVAIAGAVALRLGGAATALVFLPFALPALCLVRASVRGSRFHRGHQPLPALVETDQGEQSWRDAERTAVAATFGRALVRNRLRVS